MRIEKSKCLEGKEVTRKHKSNVLQDVTDWVTKRSGSWNIGIAPQELQSIPRNNCPEKTESLMQEISIENSSWGEYLIDRILLCSKNRRLLLKKYLKENEKYKQIQIYTDSSLQEDQEGKKRLGYELIQVDDNKRVICKIRGRTSKWASSTRAELMAILEATLISPENSLTNIFTDSAVGIHLVNRIQEDIRAREWCKGSNTAILKAIKMVIETKNLKLRLHKVKAHSGIIENDLADIEAKKGAKEVLEVEIN
jgi:ribonuclease HI